jgi:hypothetical protein
MTFIPESGYFKTPNTTPAGTSKKVAFDNPYLTKDEYITTSEAIGLGIDATDPRYSSGELERKILAASAAVNRYCKRYFDTQTIDETKTGFTVKPMNPRMVSNILRNGPYQKVNSVYLQVLNWFIQIDIANQGYFQDFPDYGYYRLVPLLSTAGTGVPLPAAIVDKIPLGVLWTNYRFGYGEDYFGDTLLKVSSECKQYQAILGKRLWAPREPTKVYVNAVEVTSGFSIKYTDGLVEFDNPQGANDIVTADFTTNETIPADIKQAVILMVTYSLGQAAQNALGATSYSIQTYSISFGSENAIEKRWKELLDPYVLEYPQLI